MSTEALPYNEVRVKAFREGLNELTLSLTTDTSPETLVGVGEKLDKLLQEYSRGVDRVIRDQSDELRSLARLVTRSLTTLAAEDGSQDTLKDLQKDLEGAHTLRDIVEFKTRLRSSLEVLQQSAEARRKQAAAAVADLKRELEESRARLAQLRVDPTKDPVTGLPIREDALNVLSFLAGKDGLSFAIVVGIQQLPALNAKFGHQIGNAILQSYRDHLLRCMDGSGRLFRWGGKCMVAIFSKTEVARASASDMVRSLSANANLEIDTGSRTVMIPVRPKWLALGRGEILSGSQLTEKIDRFAAEC